MCLTLEERVERERIRAEADERAYHRKLIEAGRLGLNPTLGSVVPAPAHLRRPPLELPDFDVRLATDDE